MMTSDNQNLAITKNIFSSHLFEIFTFCSLEPFNQFSIPLLFSVNYELSRKIYHGFNTNRKDIVKVFHKISLERLPFYKIFFVL